MTVVVMKLHFSGEHGSRVPPWLRKLVLVCLARVVRMGKHTKDTYKVSTDSLTFSQGNDYKVMFEDVYFNFLRFKVKFIFK